MNGLIVYNSNFFIFYLPPRKPILLRRDELRIVVRPLLNKFKLELKSFLFIILE